jgi:hypothetical protein
MANSITDYACVKTPAIRKGGVNGALIVFCKKQRNSLKVGWILFRFKDKRKNKPLTCQAIKTI